MRDQAVVRLAERLREGGARAPIALIGAGLSAGAGYPTWAGLMDEMHRRVLAIQPAAGPKYLQQLERMQDVLWRAEEYRRLLGERRYQALIRRTFGPHGGEDAPVEPDPATRAIAALPFSHFITTNYDPSLERALGERHGREAVEPVEWADRAARQAFLRDVWEDGGSGRRRLVYLHGRYRRPSAVVLTERDYVERYVLGDEANRKLFALFMTRAIVFVGFSLSDPDLMFLLRTANAHVGQGDPRHFAILPLAPDADATLIASTYRGKYGVEPIFYPLSDRHEKLADTLVRLRTLCEDDDVPSVEQRARAVERSAPFAEVLFEPEPGSDLDDPHRHRWGGSPVSNGLRLGAEVEPASGDWFRVRLLVEPIRPRRALSGEVRFHLHPTFVPAARAVRARRNRARLTLLAYGAFTVGVEADEGRTRLELDLASIPDAPPTFRER